MNAEPILLAESGATKTEWRLLDSDHVLHAFHGAGFNANVQSFEQIEAQLRTEVLPVLRPLPSAQGVKIVFYGSGFSNPSYCRRMEQVMAQVFAEQQPPAIHAMHDMLAAARAAAQDQPAVVCILGTGSNSCYYDGKSVVRSRGGFGYLFGDEGSGAHLGRMLLKGFLDEELPLDIQADFEAAQGMDIYALKNQVYKAEKPNVMLAALAPFVSKYTHRPEINAMVRNCFDAFVQKTIARYDGYRDLPLFVIGSIASHFRDCLRDACEAADAPIPQLVPKPIEGLVRFHQRFGAPAELVAH